MDLETAAHYKDPVRMVALKGHHTGRYGSGPEVMVRVPGRVNLIGEHIDYCGYGVHPMAIDQDILVGVTKSDTPRALCLANADPIHPDFQGDLTTVQIKPEPAWWNYFLCGIKGMLVELGIQVEDHAFGLDCMVWGNIPNSAGLSSSSALVVSGALSAVWAYGLDVSKSDLADICARSERFIGTQGGGMDQAIEILAKPGTAMLIEFNPLRTTDVALPLGATFVIVNSLADVNKAAGAEFNTRVVECRMATKVLSKSAALTDWRQKLKLKGYQESSGRSLKEALAQVKTDLHQAAYTKEELCQLLAMTETELTEKCLCANTLHLRSFNLRHRAQHVFSEAQRVYDFKRTCDDPGSSADPLVTLGTLMLESHASCAMDYECSHPALDQLVELSQTHGALGARLTGAGWGGCIVALVPEAKVQSFIQGIKTDYFSNLPSAQGKDLDSFIFPTRPGAGAAIYQMHD
eukprot:maker-scaffold906_size82779-snap-gene-0.11 protein:Tk11971 transcript:maker-scaffold906_size82779-snap-gene-0.11-mRNA-1 annotation:"n-acetylgalactosamine kinase-like"